MMNISIMNTTTTKTKSKEMNHCTFITGEKCLLAGGFTNLGLEIFFFLRINPIMLSSSAH